MQIIIMKEKNILFKMLPIILIIFIIFFAVYSNAQLIEKHINDNTKNQMMEKMFDITSKTSLQANQVILPTTILPYFGHFLETLTNQQLNGQMKKHSLSTKDKQPQVFGKLFIFLLLIFLFDTQSNTIY